MKTQKVVNNNLLRLSKLERDNGIILHHDKKSGSVILEIRLDEGRK